MGYKHKLSNGEMIQIDFPRDEEGYQHVKVYGIGFELTDPKLRDEAFEEARKLTGEITILPERNGKIVIHLVDYITPERAEQLEDDLKDLLESHKLVGNIEDSITGNTTVFRPNAYTPP